MLSKSQLKMVGLGVIGAALYTMAAATSYGKKADEVLKNVGSKV